MRLPAALRRLYALAPRGARHGLDAMREALAAEGDPQDAIECVHVAGTNGKGSVCATVEAVARAAGLRTGLYTSPHLLRFAERIRIEGAPLADDALADVLEHVLDAHPALTFFEVATLAAFLAFRDARLELLVLEVGLGGRLDATNAVMRPLATAITTIGLDHVAILGATIGAIAAEKAGILKPGAPAIVGAVSAEARTAIDARAEAVGAGPLWHLGAELDHRRDESGLLTVTGPEDRCARVRSALIGAHQDDNAAIAVALAWRTAARFPAIDARAIEHGVATVRWAGRCERVTVAEGPLAGAWLFDGAHNEDGAAALAACLTEPRSVLVFGAMADKPWGRMLERLVPCSSRRVYVEPTMHGGARPAASPLEMVAADLHGELAPDVPSALRRARALAGPQGLVVVAGSLYLVGQARALVLELESDPHVGL